MSDRARSDDPLVQRQLDRLSRLSPGRDILGLERIAHLLDKHGNPQSRLPPVFHVAGTNGKGSTCAFLRAAFEAAGMQVHVYTSPHLVRFNERIRLSGRLIADKDLALYLEKTLDAANGDEISFFEATTAAALLAFAEVPADACIVEVGLGGRLDATNVIERPAACGIAQLGFDHGAFLGTRLEDIAREKAGIAKPGVPLVTMSYSAAVRSAVEGVAETAGAPVYALGTDWDAAARGGRIYYSDHQGSLVLPAPRLPGRHQSMNAALAVAMLRHQQAVRPGLSALQAASGWADWPARLQRLAAGPLTDLLPPGSELWVDGAHNPAAARAVADFFRPRVGGGRPFHLVFGLLSNRDPEGVLKPFGRGSSTMLHSVPVPGHDSHGAEAIGRAARSAGLAEMGASDIKGALDWIARHSDRTRPPVVLIMGSLYLAGQALELNAQIPA